MKAAAPLMLIALLAWTPLWAAGDAYTVISVTGNAWTRTAEGTWAPLRAGTELSGEAWLRTGAESAVRLLEPAGRLRRIGAGQEARARVEGDAAAGAGWNLFRILGELFGDVTRSRVAASRWGDPVGELNAFYDQAWLSLLAKPRLEREDIPHVFETASHYTDPPRRNRPVALLAKLAHSFPENPGFARVAVEARQALGQPARLTLMHVTGGGESPLAARATMRSGDELRVRYQADTESYLYLFLHSRPANGTPVNLRIYPANSPQPVPAAEALVLPQADRSYRLDETVGMEYFWAWVCTGPVSLESAKAAAELGVAPALSAGGKVPPGLLDRHAPPGCVQSFGFALAHR